MTLDDVVNEGMDIVYEYKDRARSMTPSEVQEKRDILSALCVTLSEYMSDFYDTHLASHSKRRIEEAREIDRLVTEEKMPVSRAEAKARLFVSEIYKKEYEYDIKHKRTQNLLNAWNQILNTMASRMHSNARG